MEAGAYYLLGHNLEEENLLPAPFPRWWSTLSAGGPKVKTLGGETF